MKVNVLSTIVYWLARLLSATLRPTYIGEEKINEARKKHGGAVLVSWHGRTLIGIMRYRARGYWAMISTSRDGEYQTKILGLFGFKTVRGSTSARGAIASALRIAKELKNGGVLAFTPDGPRGPNRTVHPGAIFLGEKSGCPIIPIGVSAYPRKLLNTWDQHLIPHPFARAVMVYGEPIMVPIDVDDAGRKQLSDLVGQQISELEEIADSIAMGKKPALATRANES